MKFFKNHIALFLILSIIFSVYSQNLPPFTGLDSDTLTWNDSRGTHLLLLERSEIFMDKENGFSSQTIQATHWLRNGKELYKTWSFIDEIKDCPVDLEIKFLAAPQFSDLDNDEFFEIWFITQKSCKGDISPSNIQIIMFDPNDTKYIMNAQQKLIFPDTTTDGGFYDLNNFDALPKTYQNYALEYLFKNYEYNY